MLNSLGLITIYERISCFKHSTTRICLLVYSLHKFISRPDFFEVSKRLVEKKQDAVQVALSGRTIVAVQVLL